MKNKWSVQDILDFNPCDRYTKEHIISLFKSVGCKKYITREKICEVNMPIDDLFWLVLRPEFIPEKQLHQFAIWCFERTAQPIWEKLWEKYYPNDNRPQEAIRVNRLWLKGKATNEELAAAGAAAWAAAEDAEKNAAWVAAKNAAGAAAEDAEKKQIIKVIKIVEGMK